VTPEEARRRLNYLNGEPFKPCYICNGLHDTYWCLDGETRTEIKRIAAAIRAGEEPK